MNIKYILSISFKLHSFETSYTLPFNATSFLSVFVKFLETYPKKK